MAERYTPERSAYDALWQKRNNESMTTNEVLAYCMALEYAKSGPDNPDNVEELFNITLNRLNELDEEKKG